MRKFIIVFLVFLCLSFNIIGLKPAFAAANVFKQGIYTLSDFNVSDTGIYTIQNVSTTEGMYLFIFDANQVTLASLRLVPSIQKFDTIPIKPNYTILIVGKGEVYISTKSTT